MTRQKEKKKGDCRETVAVEPARREAGGLRAPGVLVALEEAATFDALHLARRQLFHRQYLAVGSV